jgi:hypothetical protein
MRTIRAKPAWPVCAVLIQLCCSAPTRTPDPRNELPFGVVDVPSRGATVGPTAFVSGWAMDDGKIHVVKVYLDGRFVSEARLGLERPDVSKAFPRYAHGTNAHGWGIEIDLRDLTGAHTVIVQATDDSGATRDLGAVSLNVKG